MSQNTGSNVPEGAKSPQADGKPALPERSWEDTDIAWGGQVEPDDDERLLRDRPPHWDSV